MLEEGGIGVADAGSSALDNAIALHQAGWYQEALDYYRQCLAVEPGNMVALVYGGVALMDAGQVDEAVRQLQGAATLRPDQADIQTYLANALMLAGEPSAAEQHYLRAIELDPVDPAAHGNFGALLKDMGRLDEAVRQLQRAIQLRPGYGPAYNNLCESFRHQGKIIAAIEAGETAVAIDPDSAHAYNNYGAALIDAGRVDDAVAAYQRAVAIAPKYVDALNNLAIALIMRGAADEAITTVQHCLKLDPGNIQALATLSVALNEVGDAERYGALTDEDLLIRQTVVDAPDGYDDLTAFNEALANHVRTHPSLAKGSEKNATRSGLHSGDLLVSPTGPMEDFEGLIREKVSDYVDAIPGSRDHPFFVNTPDQFVFDIWGLVLTGQGHQVPHIHPGGWLSGCYYPKVPDHVSDDDPEHHGWFEFGRPQTLYRSQAEPQVHPVCPTEGLLLLFPSFIFHRTIPVATAEERISIAFDVLPVA